VYIVKLNVQPNGSLCISTTITTNAQCKSLALYIENVVQNVYLLMGWSKPPREKPLLIIGEIEIFDFMWVKFVILMQLAPKTHFLQVLVAEN
jgi:hypothetical protein